MALAALPAVARENYALLIGAAEYKNLDQKYWLKGPANDVRLVQTYLTTEAPVPFAEKDVIVLADGVEVALHERGHCFGREGGFGALARAQLQGQ